MSSDHSKTFAVYPDGQSYEIAYGVRLLSDTYVVEGEPGEIDHHAGEVVVLNAHDAIQALAQGRGVLVGEVTDGIRSGPPICTFCGACGYGPCKCL